MFRTIQPAPLLSLAMLLALASALSGCTRAAKPTMEAAEEEALARTEFTPRIENFFEYEPLKAGQPSLFRIHLTDLTDGAPVEQAEVTLHIRNQPPVKAKVGKVTGIYVAELTVTQKGDYAIEFQIKNTKLDERMPLTDFKVE